MNKKENTTDSTTLIFKNIPKQIEDLTSLLNSLQIPAKQIKSFGRKRALISYELKNEAELALNILKQLEFCGQAANVSLFCKDKSKENKDQTQKSFTKRVHKSVQTTLEANGSFKSDYLTQQQLSKYVQKLYAIEGELGFEQPPAPYLKYSYPPINKDIMDNICISLLSNNRFYTQVLHLMNRMSLEPPFNKRSCKFTPPGLPKEVSTQTEKVIVQNEILSTSEQGGQEREVEEIESELESSGEDTVNIRHQVHVKRKLPAQVEQYKKKARQMLQTAHKLSKGIAKKQTTTNLSLKAIFENPEPITTNKIELQVKRHSQLKETREMQRTQLNLPIELKTQKLPSDEIEKLSIYKNYQKGPVSHKLYIKNLHKDVTTEDLRLIYERYLKDESIHLDIKVMQHGRMKGQAFITFQCDQMETIKPIISSALEETNGFILRGKPLVVCYGKTT